MWQRLLVMHLPCFIYMHLGTEKQQLCPPRS
ncbi:hypothetical protein GLYMA_03G028651v4 [Glycine max]|nr:hypothetical protein GLYMA_03G028651v4 [Glycine max]KAH1068401.1 hypothetical protein GYH30_006091 [Glycine max]